MRRSQAILALVAVVAAAAVITLLLSRSSPDGAFPGAGDEQRYADFGAAGPTFTRADELVQALAQHGVECSGLEQQPASSGQRERATCQASSDDVVIRIFDDNAARNRYLSQARAVLDQSRTEAVPLLAGPNWIVTADTEAIVATFQRALGGEALAER